MAKRIQGKLFHGFDSFEGLPQEWSGFDLRAREFDMKGKMPRVPSNVRLYRGHFEATLPDWVAANPGPVAFMHVDCDLYSSTQIIFNLLAERIVPGTIILFDEYFNYPNWEQHEFKAFQEFVTARSIKYEYLAFARQQVAARIESSFEVMLQGCFETMRCSLTQLALGRSAI